MNSTTGDYTTVRLGYGTFEPECGPGEFQTGNPALVKAPLSTADDAQTCWNSFPEELK